MNLDAEDESYVPLIRKIKASDIVRSGPKAQLMMWLLTDAAYYDRAETVQTQHGTINVKLTKGESFINVGELSSYLRIPEQTFRRTLKRLEDRGTIEVEKQYGGYKVRLVNAQRYWDRYEQDSRSSGGTVSEHLIKPVTQSGSNEQTTSGNGRNGVCSDHGASVVGPLRNANPQDQEAQGLGSPLELIESLSSTDVCSKNSLSTKNKKESLVVGVGEKTTTQLDLISPDPVPVDSRDDEIEISQFLGEKEEQQWNALKQNVKCIRALLKNYDKPFILQQLGFAYQWWIENPRKRSKNTAAFLGGWLRRNKTGYGQPAGRNQNRTTRVQAPVEPGKYDGIGVTYSAYEE